MPRTRASSPPSYCLHKASGRAVVRIGGVDHYLGIYGSSASHDAYARLIAKWRVEQVDQTTRQEQVADLASFDLTLAQVIQRYRDYARTYYNRDGKPTKEFVEMRYSLRPVRLLYGDIVARDFGPLKLKVVRQFMIDELDLSRGVVNRRVNRIKRFFRWAVSEELVPSSVTQALSTVAGLRRGRTNAREAPRVMPVADVWVEMVLPHLSPQVAAMVRIQRLTGMRPGEVVLMRACDLDMSGDVWVFEPHSHKNEWRELGRFVPLGPKAQDVIRPFLGLSMDRYLFSPRDAEAWRNERRAEHRNPNRKTQV